MEAYSYYWRHQCQIFDPPDLQTYHLDLQDLIDKTSSEKNKVENTIKELINEWLQTGKTTIDTFSLSEQIRLEESAQEDLLNAIRDRIEGHLAFVDQSPDLKDIELSSLLFEGQSSKVILSGVIKNNSDITLDKIKIRILINSKCVEIKDALC